MNRSENINELALALNKAQAEMGGAVTDANNPFFKSKYADLGSIIKVIKPPFANNGLSYSQFPITEENRIGVETVIMHSSGQYISNEFTMNVPKADPQSAGGVISYCRRYALQAVCGVPAVDSDAEDFMVNVREDEKKAIAEERKIVKKGAINQSNGDHYLSMKWKGQNYKGETLGDIADKDLDYLKDVATNHREKVEKTPNGKEILKALDFVIDFKGKGLQDFKEVK